MTLKGYSEIDPLDLSSLSFPAAIWMIQAPPKTDLLSLLNTTMGFRTTLPQDKVYSLLGLATEDFASAARRPDYSKPANEVFCSIVKSIIQETQSLPVLREIDHGEQFLENMTSWVPPWASPEKTLNNLLEDGDSPSKADAGRALYISSSKYFTVISLMGILVDKTIYQSEIATKLMHLSHKTSQKEIWDAIAPRLGGASARYKTGHMMGMTFTQLVTQGIYPGEVSKVEALQYYLDAAVFWAQTGAVDLQQICTTEAQKLARCHEGNATTIGNSDSFKVASANAVGQLRIFLTADGYLGIGPPAMRVGDQVCILYGSGLPFILRALQTRYRLIGCCYVQGIMQGEAVKLKEADNQLSQIFEIIQVLRSRSSDRLHDASAASLYFITYPTHRCAKARVVTVAT
jgi:hypothetical protein